MEGWVGVITDAGNALLARYMTDHLPMTIDQVLYGTGLTPQIDMRRATALVSEAGSGSIEAAEAITNGTRFRIRFGAAEEYTLMTEVGLYGYLGNDSSNKTMIALFQNEHGKEIPAASTYADFSYLLVDTLAISNDGNLTVVLDPAALVSRRMLEQARYEDTVGLYVDEQGFMCQRIRGDVEG